jgi:hypothetical protein
MAELQLDQALAAGMDFIRAKKPKHGSALRRAKEYLYLAIVGQAGTGAGEQPQARIDTSRGCVLARVNKDLTSLKFGRSQAGDVHGSTGTRPYALDLAPMILKAANPTTKP